MIRNGLLVNSSSSSGTEMIKTKRIKLIVKLQNRKTTSVSYLHLWTRTAVLFAFDRGVRTVIKQ